MNVKNIETMCKGEEYLKKLKGILAAVIFTVLTGYMIFIFFNVYKYENQKIEKQQIELPH